MYDDIGCMTTLPRDYVSTLTSMGIKAKTFAKVTPFFSTHYNNRDHRKILVIDGKAAFSGGINLADEYINKEERFGKWKDNCFSAAGDAVRNYTLMFLQLWNTTVSQDAKLYQPYVSVRSDKSSPGRGRFYHPLWRRTSLPCIGSAEHLSEHHSFGSGLCPHHDPLSGLR